MILPGQVIHGKAARERLHITRLGFCRGVRFARILLRFGAGDVFCLRERQQVAQLGCVG
jgi:hypothetical protein